MRAAMKRPDNIKIPAHVVRKDMGDMRTLCDQLRDWGQLQAVGVDVNDNLVFGYRRLEAIKLNGGEWVHCVVLENAHDLATALSMQMVENVGRKDFTPSEKVTLARMIEESVKASGVAEVPVPKGAVKPGAETVNVPTEVDQDVLPFSAVAKTAAEKVGMSPATLAKAKAVVDAAAEEPERYGDVKAAMDKTGEVAPAHREVVRRKAKSESLKDSQGVEVPMLLRDVFGDKKWLLEALESMELIVRDVEKTAKAVQARGPAYPWMLTGKVLEHLRAAIDAVETASSLVDTARPYAVCACCNGKGKVTTGEGVANCTDCRGCGWLPEHRHEELHAA